MRRILVIALLLIAVPLMAAGVYAGKGYIDATRQAPELKLRAAALLADRRGPDMIEPEFLRILILVEDPGFEFHKGVDLTTKGAGVTTMTQALSKRLGFRNFRPGLPKIRQTGYALGLEARLTKSEILTLWLDMVPMGRDAEGKWTTGFFTASEAFFGKPLSALSREEYIALVALPIAPGRLSPLGREQEFEERTARISRLADGSCAPRSVRDAWLEGCASEIP